MDSSQFANMNKRSAIFKNAAWHIMGKTVKFR